MKKNIFCVTILFLLINPVLWSQWFPQHSDFPLTSPYFSLWAIDTNTAIVGTIYYGVRTSNGGTNWVYNLNPSGYIDDYYFINSTTGFMVDREGYPSGSRLYKSTNAGLSWDTLPHLPVLSSYSLSFNDVNTGYASTLGAVYKTTNGGFSWVNTYTELTNVQKIFFVDANTGWGITDIGNVIKTTNGGGFWDITTVDPGNSLNNLFFINGNTGWIAGSNSSVYKSTNNGWSPWVDHQIALPTCELDAVYFANDMTGWVTGCNGSIHRTTDGGITWIQQTIGATTRLYRIQFVNALTGWAAGESGVILHTTNGGVSPNGIQPIGNSIPKQISLSQNYPNPFNPATKIRFDIPKESLAKIEVYDVSGRTVDIIVNENLKAWTYQVDFNGNSLASGVYYYRLTAGDFVETKKMILLK